MRICALAVLISAVTLFSESFLPFIHAGGEVGYTGNLYQDATRVSDGFGRLTADGGWNWRLADGLINRTRIDAEYDYFAVNPYASFLDGSGITSFELHPLDGLLLTAEGGYRLYVDDAARFVNRFVTNDLGKASGAARIGIDLAENMELSLGYSFAGTTYFSYDLDSVTHEGRLSLSIRPSLFTAIVLSAGYDYTAFPERHTLVVVTNTVVNDTALRADQHAAGSLTFSIEDNTAAYVFRAEGFWRDSNGDSAITTNSIDKDYFDETGGLVSFTATITPAEGTTIGITAMDRVSLYPLRSSLDQNYQVTAAMVLQNYFSVSLEAEHALIRGDHGLSLTGSAGYFRSDSGDFFTRFDGIDIHAGLKFWL